MTVPDAGLTSAGRATPSPGTFRPSVRSPNVFGAPRSGSLTVVRMNKLDFPRNFPRTPRQRAYLVCVPGPLEALWVRV